MRDPDIVFDFEPLMRRLQIIEVIDESEPQYDFAGFLQSIPAT